MTAKETTPEVETKLYELMFILQPDLRESEVKKQLKDFEEALEGMGAKIVEKDLWGKRQLAYRIGKYDHGIYAVYNFEVVPKEIKELDEAIRLDKNIIRHLIITVPEGYKYTKYDLDAPVKVEKETPAETKPKPKAKKEEIKREEEEKGQAPEEGEVSKKLDEIIEGDDLNL